MPVVSESDMNIFGVGTTVAPASSSQTPNLQNDSEQIKLNICMR